jgi:hypothetical protein
MRVLVCGGRTFGDIALLDTALNEVHAATPIVVVIQGEAKGADALGKAWARRNRISCIGYAADWRRWGNRAAGPIRNQKMLDEGQPDLVLAFPGGNGTADMVRRATGAGIPVKRYPAEGAGS